MLRIPAIKCMRVIEYKVMAKIALDKLVRIQIETEIEITRNERTIHSIDWIT